MSNFPVLQVHCPEVNSKAKDIENCRFILPPFKKPLELFAEMSEECETFHDRLGRLDKVMRHSIVLSAIKTKVPLEIDDIQHIRIFFYNKMKNELRT